LRNGIVKVGRWEKGKRKEWLRWINKEGDEMNISALSGNKSDNITISDVQQ